jgi:hypothetical protein
MAKFTVMPDNNIVTDANYEVLASQLGARPNLLLEMRDNFGGIDDPNPGPTLNSVSGCAKGIFFVVVGYIFDNDVVTNEGLRIMKEECRRAK